jgi:hypothetical protein
LVGRPGRFLAAERSDRVAVDVAHAYNRVSGRSGTWAWVEDHSGVAVLAGIGSLAHVESTDATDQDYHAGVILSVNAAEIAPAPQQGSQRRPRMPTR